ncbi:MAG: hypothetical protein R3F40_11635 [Candidatus Competibacteraceae bacterium]
MLALALALTGIVAGIALRILALSCMPAWRSWYSTWQSGNCSASIPSKV